MNLARLRGLKDWLEALPKTLHEAPHVPLHVPPALADFEPRERRAVILCMLPGPGERATPLFAEIEDVIGGEEIALVEATPGFKMG